MRCVVESTVGAALRRLEATCCLYTRGGGAAAGAAADGLTLSAAASSIFHPLKEYYLSFTTFSKRFRHLFLHRLQQRSLNFVLYILFSKIFSMKLIEILENVFFDKIFRRLHIANYNLTWGNTVFRAFLDATTTDPSSLVPSHPSSSLRGFFWNSSSTPPPPHPRSSESPPPSLSTLVLLPCRGPPRHHSEACLRRHSRGPPHHRSRWLQR